MQKIYLIFLQQITMADYNLKFDITKKRNLKRLREKDKNKEDNNYPISKSDLRYIYKCPLCGTNKASRISEVYLQTKLNFFSTDVCRNCLFVYRSISPSYRWFQKCWKKIKAENPEPFNTETELFRKKYYKKYHTLIAKFSKEKTLLDIGAAYGSGTMVFRDLGYDVEAIEPEDNKKNYLQKKLNIKVVSKSVEDFISKNHAKKYGIVIFSHCLEHLDSPINIIRSIKKFIKPMGILYIEVPMLWNYTDWSDAFYLTHKSNFTEKGLVNLAAREGFDTLARTRFKQMPNDPPNIGLVLRVAQKNKMPKIIKQEDKTIDDVKRLYRKKIPLSPVPKLGEILKYNIAQIEQFYYTIRLINKRGLKKEAGSDFIHFY
jgi:SAM-dependent methyltransferase